MEITSNDIFCFSHEHLIAQIAGATKERGHYHVRFYAANGLLSRDATDTVSDFFYYPSAGTIRDSDMNIVYYSSLIDHYNKKRGEIQDR